MKYLTGVFILGCAFVLTPVSVAYGDNPRSCRDRCDKQMDKLEYVTQSGAQSKQYDACMEGCQRLENLMNRFKECIKNADTESDKESCRSDYRKNRWSKHD